MEKTQRKKIFSFALPLLLVVGIFLFGPSAHALGEELVSTILSFFTGALGQILILVIKGLIWIASYQTFIDSQAVVLGWVIVRDLCNMFFVIVLLIIAFGTILHLENYSYKKWLPKLVLMAILINFSKTICGLLIDLSQVVMLTFVNAFKDVGGANLTDILGLTDIVTLAKGSEDIGWGTIIGAYFLAIAYLVVAIIVIVTMLAMLVMRLVTIWIYVVLSPIAYLLSAFPGGQSWASRWWSDFTKALIVGPVIAFFLWLSLAALQTGNPQSDLKKIDEGEAIYAASTTVGVVGSKASTPGALIKFIIAIGMLIGGLKVAQEVGGEVGSIAGKGMAAVGKAKAWAVNKGLSGDNLLARKFARVSGIDFRPVKLAESWKASMDTSKKKDETAIRQAGRKHYDAGGLRSVVLGMGAGEAYFNNYGSFKGAWRGGKEVFYNKRKRKQIAQDMDSTEKEGGLLQETKSNLLQKKRKSIDKRAEAALSSDEEYNKYKLTDNEQVRMADLKAKGKLNKTEKEELKDLEENHLKAEDRKSVVHQDVENKFLKSDKSVLEIEAKIKLNDDKIRALKTAMNKAQAPVAFEARSAYRSAVEEAKGKYKTITNSDELMKALTDAMQRGDKFDQVAILEKLSSDANLNEELRAKGYSSNAKGLHAYVFNKENDAGQQKGLAGNFSDQERIEIQNDLGELEERVGHWEMAKMAGMNSKGEMESYVQEKRDKDGKVMRDEKGRVMYDDSKHATAAYAEVIKFDPQKIVNSMNRLAMGGEDGSGKFQVSNLGKMIFRYLASSGAYEKNSGRIVGNTAANLISGDNVEELKDAMRDNPDKFEANIKILREKGSSPDGSMFADDAYRIVSNRVTKKKSQKKDENSASASSV